MEFSYPVTVFTPTYNRAYILGDLYHSLQRQTCMDFEWLIVDDGSADDTKALVASWQGEENPFPIRYVYQENGGKCRAINRGLKEADGRLFFTVDSDDYLTDDAIEKVIRWDGELPISAAMWETGASPPPRPPTGCFPEATWTEPPWIAMTRWTESVPSCSTRRFTGSTSIRSFLGKSS